ncbi:unnamed protein product [Cuscuta campestris]|uniref:Uncharacterized protein n=1 Tax=Cuscuta campestris TaxID=132261 RepID=A0A484LH68_9ASTE|nr:unnamed protein product [Cuscuta campestris]
MSRSHLPIFITLARNHLPTCLYLIGPHVRRHLQVLPFARKRFFKKKPREILYESICLMPLKLTERVLPWLVGSLNEDEAQNLLHNMQLAGAFPSVPFLK